MPVTPVDRDVSAVCGHAAELEQSSVHSTWGLGRIRFKLAQYAAAAANKAPTLAPKPSRLKAFGMLPLCIWSPQASKSRWSEAALATSASTPPTTTSCQPGNKAQSACVWRIA